jgi:hypothetical protein
VILVALGILGSSGFVTQAAQIPPFFNVVEYGAVGEGRALCTQAIQRAVDNVLFAPLSIGEYTHGKFGKGSVFVMNFLLFSIFAIFFLTYDPNIGMRMSQ